MKIFKTIAIFALYISLFCGTISCVVYTEHDKGKHKGWYKNTNNPHNANTTNPGKSEGNHKK